MLVIGVVFLGLDQTIQYADVSQYRSNNYKNTSKTCSTNNINTSKDSKKDKMFSLTL